MELNVLALYNIGFGKNIVPYDTLHRVNLEPSAGFSGEYREGDYVFLPLWLDGYRMPNEPLISISMTKHVIETKVADLKGTVTEEISLGNYKVIIKGVIINNESTEELPQTEIRKIRQICEKLEAVDCTNDLLTYYDITKLTVKSASFPGIPGEKNAQTYEIVCSSYRDVELVLKKDWEATERKLKAG